MVNYNKHHFDYTKICYCTSHLKTLQCIMDAAGYRNPNYVSGNPL